VTTSSAASLLDRCRLTFEPSGEIRRTVLQLAGIGRNPLGIGMDIAHHLGQPLDRAVEVAARLLHAGRERAIEPHRELAVGKLADGIAEFADAGHARRHVGGELDDLVDFAPLVEDRVVGGLDPDRLAALAITNEFVRQELALCERRPEVAIGIRLDVIGVAEHPVMLAADLVEGIAERSLEILVRIEDRAIGLELDHGLRARDGAHLALIVERLVLGIGDIGGDLDHLDHLAAAYQRIVGRFDPDLAAALGKTLVLALVVLAGAQPVPEFGIFRRPGIGRIDEHRMVLADDFGPRVAHGRAEILVGVDDRAIGRELDHRLRPSDRFHFVAKIVAEN